MTLDWGNIYRIDLELTAPVTLLDGWIGISAYNPVEERYHISYFGHDESDLTPLMHFDGNWVSETNTNNLFCLGTEPAPLPLSMLALYLSIFMIGLFIMIRLCVKNSVQE